MSGANGSSSGGGGGGTAGGGVVTTAAGTVAAGDGARHATALEEMSSGARLFLVAGFSSVFTKTCVAPLDRARTIAQTGVSQSSSHGVLPIFRNVLKQDGLRGLWKGNVANCSRVFPSRGILFACNDLYKSIMRRAAGVGPNDTLPAWASFVAGALAGTTANVVTYPLDFTRTQMAASLGKDSPYTTVTGTLKSVFKARGLRGLYHGIPVTLAGTVVYEGSKFGFYDLVRSFRGAVVPEEASTAMEILWKLSCGAIAGTAAGMLTFPNDTVRKLIIVQRLQGAARPAGAARAGAETSVQFRGALDCYRYLWREHGVRRFYQGLTPYLLRSVPNAAIQFTTFEYLKKLFVSEYYSEV